MTRFTIPSRDFVAVLRRAIADKDIDYTDHLIHDFVFCDENAFAKLDRLPALVEMCASPYIGTSDGRPAFAHHTSPATYAPLYSSALDYAIGQAVWEK